MTGTVLSLLMGITLMSPMTEKSPTLKAPDLYPTPQKAWFSGDGWLLGKRIDLRFTNGTLNALRYFTIALQDNATEPLEILSIPATQPIESTAETEIYVIRPMETDPVLRALLSPILEDRVWWSLPDDGFLIVSGLFDYDNVVFVLSNSDRGFLYASDAFAKLLVPHRGTVWMRQGMLLDYPSFQNRAVLEAFAGPPWAQADRESVVQFMQRMRMNFYLYSPVGDPYTYEKWSEAYPKENLAVLAKLAEQTALLKIDLCYGIRLDRNFRFGDENAASLVCAKFRAIADLGVTSFAILIRGDAIDLQYPEDKATFADAGEAHGAFCNKVLQFLRAEVPGSQLLVCPADPNRIAAPPYLRTLSKTLHPDVPLFWMGGVGWVEGTDNYQMRASDAKRVQELTGKLLFGWDNYPCNELARNRLFMGPVEGRSPDLADRLIGFGANPMNEAMSSTVPLATLADFLWNPKDYDPERSLKQACAVVGGEAADDLLFFCQQSRSSLLWGTDAEEMKEQLDQFKVLLSIGRTKDFDETKLLSLWERYQSVADNLSWNLESKRFFEEIKPYLDLMRVYGQAGPVCLRLLELAHEKDSTSGREEIWNSFLQLVAKRNEAARSTRSIVQPLMPALMKDAFTAGLEALNAALPKVETNLTPYSEFTIDRALDGDRETFFWCNKSLQKGDSLTFELPAAGLATKIEVLQAEPTRAKDFIQNGVIEISLDGEQWTALGEIHKPEESLVFGKPLAIRFARVRVLADQTSRLLLREFRVYLGSEVEISMKPSKLLAGSLSALVNGNLLDSCTFLAGIDKDAQVLLDLGQPKALDAVFIYQDRKKHHDSFRVESSENLSRWDYHAVEQGSIAQARFAPTKARYIRLTATKDDKTPFILHEIVLREARVQAKEKPKQSPTPAKTQNPAQTKKPAAPSKPAKSR